MAVSGTMDVHAVRAKFPALAVELDGRPCVFADAPGGTQVPEAVIEAMTDYFGHRNANTGGAFATSRATDEVIEEARRGAADLLGARPDEIAFGQNMTTLAFALARSVARTLHPGDEVVVTRLDHDANIAPWLAAAGDAGATVRWVDVHAEDCTIDVGSLRSAVSERTRIVAFTLASNAVGTVTPGAEIARIAREAGAVAIADGVHLAPHRPIDVVELGVDVLFCSAYKLFGPHLGLMFCRRELMDSWEPYKVRPQEDTAPLRWETGTLCHEGLAGFTAAVDYLAGLGRNLETDEGERRGAVVAGLRAVQGHEARLSTAFLSRLSDLPEIRLYGIRAPDRVEERTPTFAIRVGDRSPRSVAEELGRRGIFVWDGNYFAPAIMERLGLESTGGAVRVGFCHYATLEEVERVLDELAAIARPGDR